jgi:CRP-like cAMP-binding protein
VASAPIELLRRVPLFADLERRELEQVAQSMKERVFRSGEAVAQEGSGGVGFFVIAEGRAKVSVRGQERAALGPGDYFGEIALIDEGQRSATITATSELICHGLTLWDFRPLVEGDGRIGWKLLQTLAARLRDADRPG